MFDDLDDLLNDHDTKSKPTPTLNKFKSAITTKKKDDDDFDFDEPPTKSQMTFGQSKKQSSILTSSNMSGQKDTFSKLDTFGGKTVKKEEKKAEDWDDWAAEEQKQSFGNKANRDDGRNSVGSYTGFGVLGKPKTYAQSAKKKDHDDDDLDDIISDLAVKKGVEIQKKEEPIQQQQRPQTGDTKRNHYANSNQKFKSSVDPWERDNLDELEDLDNKSKHSGGATSSNMQQMQDKKRALFGLGGGATANAQYAGQDSPSFTNHQRGQNTSKSVGRVPDINGGFLENQEEYGNAGFGMATGNQESQIEALDFGNSRTRSMRKMPINNQKPQTASSLDVRPQQQQNFGRPPTGGQQQPSQIQFTSQERVQSSPSIQNNQQQYVNQGTFNITPLQRPYTGNQSGKPPKHGGITSQEEGENDGNVLDLLGESKDRSYKGSQTSQGGGGPALFQSIDHEENQFEQYEEGGDDEEQYDEDEDDDDGGSMYQPTSMVRAGIAPQKKKNIKKAPTQKGFNTDIPSKDGTQSMFGGYGSGPKSNFDNQGHLINSDRKNQTIGSDQERIDPNLILTRQNTTAQQPPLFVGLGSGSLGSQVAQLLPPQPPIDEKAIIQKQIEEERLKIKQVEERQRKQIEDTREEHKKNMKALEEKQLIKLSLYNEEKRRLIEEMNKTIELEKDKLQNLHKIDVDNREIQYKKNLSNQKKLYEEQHQNLKKQLEQQVQMNTFAQEISKSSGSINQLSSKLGVEQEHELKRREEELVKREKELQEKRRAIAERKAQADQRRRKLQLELEDVQNRDHNIKLDYEKEKSEIVADIDKMELEHQQVIREIRNRTIDMEVDSKKTKMERDKIVSGMELEEKLGEERLEELAQQKRQLVIEKEDFRHDMEAAEKELRLKLRELKEKEKDVDEEEKLYFEKERQFDVENRNVMEDYERLQEHIDKYCIEKESFDREAFKIKEQGERDQMDSEKIGFFKANKDRLKDELVQLREDLETERDSIREDRIKLEMYKNELKTRQKTIENIRYEYIKTNQESQHRFLDDTRDVGYYKLQRAAGGPVFYPINPPKFEQKKENIAPMHRVNDSFAQQRAVPEPYVPRFNYNDYMRGLNEKLKQTAPVTSQIKGSDFQMYILKERETYLKGVQDYDAHQPLIQSISQFRSSHHDGIDNHEASFNLGSLQNSAFDKNGKKNGGLLNSQLGKSSANSLHFISKNFSNTPVEEADIDHEESHLHL